MLKSSLKAYRPNLMAYVYYICNVIYDMLIISLLGYVEHTFRLALLNELFTEPVTEYCGRVGDW